MSHEGAIMRNRLLLLSPLILLACLLFIALGGYVVRQLWNWLLPPLFGWHAITFWQALGLLALCRILFGGFGMRGRGGRRWGGRGWRGRPGPWHRPTWEERERFKEAVRQKYGPSEPIV